MADFLYPSSAATSQAGSFVNTDNVYKHRIAAPTQHFVNFEIDSDSDEGEIEQNKQSSVLRRRQPVTTEYLVSPSGRPIAGSKRIVSHRNNGGRSSGEVMLSITATPAFSNTSFEEMRMECYVQSQVATGGRPRAVDPVKTPWAVIPPVFNAFRGGPAELDEDVPMFDNVGKYPDYIAGALGAKFTITQVPQSAW